MNSGNGTFQVSFGYKGAIKQENQNVQYYQCIFTTAQLVGKEQNLVGRNGAFSLSLFFSLSPFFIIIIVPHVEYTYATYLCILHTTHDISVK